MSTATSTTTKRRISTGAQHGPPRQSVSRRISASRVAMCERVPGRVLVGRRVGRTASLSAPQRPSKGVLDPFPT